MGNPQIAQISQIFMRGGLNPEKEERDGNEEVKHRGEKERCHDGTPRTHAVEKEPRRFPVGRRSGGRVHPPYILCLHE
jgi:hypothetical protein